MAEPKTLSEDELREYNRLRSRKVKEYWTPNYDAAILWASLLPGYYTEFELDAWIAWATEHKHRVVDLNQLAAFVGGLHYRRRKPRKEAAQKQPYREWVNRG